jgi:hypothetical protein
LPWQRQNRLIRVALNLIRLGLRSPGPHSKIHDDWSSSGPQCRPQLRPRASDFPGSDFGFFFFRSASMSSSRSLLLTSLPGPGLRVQVIDSDRDRLSDGGGRATAAPSAGAGVRVSRFTGMARASDSGLLIVLICDWDAAAVDSDPTRRPIQRLRLGP